MDRKKSPPSPRVLAAILVVHALITSVTWRDLRRRSAGEVRGSKRMWRLLSGLNTLGTVGYFVAGRRRAGSGHER